ncbi:hypothetical protein DXT99_09320 [Pontibacter diazotrophicus]|uniref:Uncharacterized protein n=1 Tax=Pontibacter diazotrophicus TaxID=1400979 RepID=A0A3D8LE12_9BACT|nr:hypothetical protein DXT99_09320 [Pontibacter diazotrophicus]
MQLPGPIIVLQQNEYSGANYKSLKFKGEDNLEKAWRKRLYIPVTFLLEKKSKKQAAVVYLCGLSY